MKTNEPGLQAQALVTGPGAHTSNAPLQAGSHGTTQYNSLITSRTQSKEQTQGAAELLIGVDVGGLAATIEQRTGVKICEIVSKRGNHSAI